MKCTIKKAIKAAGLNADNFSISSDGQFESTLENIRKANAESNKVCKELRKMGYRIDGYKTGYGLWVYDANLSSSARYMRELISLNMD